MSVHNFLKGILIGGGVAGVISLLANPATGKENLNSLKGFIEEVKEEADRASGNIQNIQARTSEIQDLLQSTVHPAISGIQRSVSDFQFQAEPRIKQITEDIEALTERIEQR